VTGVIQKEEMDAVTQWAEERGDIRVTIKGVYPRVPINPF